jgi:hypothetical protein
MRPKSQEILDIARISIRIRIWLQQVSPFAQMKETWPVLHSVDVSHQLLLLRDVLPSVSGQLKWLKCLIRNQRKDHVHLELFCTSRCLARKDRIHHWGSSNPERVWPDSSQQNWAVHRVIGIIRNRDNGVAGWEPSWYHCRQCGLLPSDQAGHSARSVCVGFLSFKPASF